MTSSCGAPAGVGEWLIARGFASGVGVPALVDESPAAIALLAGAALVGRPLAPLGTRLSPAELAGAVQGLDGTGLVTTPDLLDLATDVAQRAGVPVHVLEAVPASAAVPEEAAGPGPGRRRRHRAHLRHHRRTQAGARAPPPARCSYRRSTRPRCRSSRVTASRSASPFHHTTGVNMVLTALGMGASVIPQARFTVEGWRVAGRLGVTHALLVPTMIDRLLEEGALGDAQPARSCSTAWRRSTAPPSREALAALPDVEFLQIFGQTEVSPLTALTHADHLLGLGIGPSSSTRWGGPWSGSTSGSPTPAPTGSASCSHGTRTPSSSTTTAGATPATWGASTTRATSRCTVGRTIASCGRARTSIRSRSSRPSCSHPAVREVVVVGVPDRRYGELVKAVVVPTDPSSPPSVEELQRHARLGLARFKVPSVIELVDELPRNAGGKILRRSLTASRAPDREG